MTITQNPALLSADGNSKLYLAPTADPEFGQEWLSKQSANGQEAMANADVVAEQAVTDAANADE